MCEFMPQQTLGNCCVLLTGGGLGAHCNEEQVHMTKTVESRTRVDVKAGNDRP